MKARTGFSLIEVLLATTILAIGIAALMAIMQAGWTANANNEEQNIFLAALSGQVERLKASTMAYYIDTEFSPEGTFPSTEATAKTSYFPVFGLLADSSIPVKYPVPATSAPPYPPFNGNWYNDTRFPASPAPPFEPGREPALGTIKAWAPPIDYPGAGSPLPSKAGNLVQFTITIEYRSRSVSGDGNYMPGRKMDTTTESVTIWVSPTY